MYKIKIENLRDISNEILINCGVPKEDADIVSDSVIFAHTRGKHTHGIGRMPIYVRKIKEGLMNPSPSYKFIKDSPVVSIMDAENGFGQVAAIHAMNACIEKAMKFGIGLVGVKDSNNFGTAGFIGEYASNAGMIGIIFSNSGPAIAPTGGDKAIFGTNPICFAYPPTDKHPAIIFDMACSNAARGKIRLAAKNGEKIPLGWAVDSNGCETTDPNEALKGTMLPIGGYKGFGISLCIDILAGMMTNSAFGGAVKNLNNPNDKSRYGHMIMTINPDFFLSKEEYSEKMEILIKNVKSCGKKGDIFLPGEKSYMESLKHKDFINLKENLVNEINELTENMEINKKL